MGTSFRHVLAALLLVVLAAASTADDVDRTARLHHGAWRLESPLGEVAGPFLVAVRTDGSWRCELAVSTAEHRPSREDLRQRRGRGWTLTGTADGGFAKGWDEPWRELGPAATAACGELIKALQVGGSPSSGSGGLPLRWQPAGTPRPATVVLDDWSGLPEAWRPPADHRSDGCALRRRLTARGRGRGGDGLVLDLRWDGDALSATSARFPGRVTMSLADDEPADLPDEAFLPLWPLAAFRP